MVNKIKSKIKKNVQNDEKKEIIDREKEIYDDTYDKYDTYDTYIKYDTYDIDKFFDY